mmetsp:Transcript_15897/g.45707  ORF Transcript_15897/g.45707 Transcript_15897/m.45707 type:complete len:145 (-) Transcript_15897:502-936(-)
MEKSFQSLLRYQEQNKHTLVPRTGEHTKLGHWVRNQRALYQRFQKTGKKGISAKRIRKIEAAGFQWNAVEAAWETKFQELITYKNRMGDCRVPQFESTHGLWVKYQRQEYKKQHNKKSKSSRSNVLSNERVARLESIGFEWTLR